MIRKILLYVVFLIFFVGFISAETVNYEGIKTIEKSISSDVCSLEISVKTKTIGKIIVLYTFKNETNNEVSFLSSLLYQDSGITFYADGEKLTGDSKVKIEWDFFPNKSDYIVIKPNQEITYSIEYKLRYSLYLQNGKIHFGKCIYCPITKTTIPLNKKKQIQLQGNYFLVDSEIELLAEYGLPFSPSILESNIITIDIP